ncbi:MAG: YceI family protein [Pseudomonadota bacterium]
MVNRLLFLLLLPVSALADWQSTDDSTLSFEASFEGSPLPGDVTEFDVSYTVGEKLTVAINLASSDLGDDDMNAVLFDAAWFGTEFTQASFTAESFEAGTDGGVVANGELELKGVSSAVAVPFTWVENGDSATMEGEVTLVRTDFNVGTGEWSTGESIGLDVLVRFTVTLAR